MNKKQYHAIAEGIVCLLNIHLSNQRRGFDNKELTEAHDKYIASSIKLIEQSDPLCSYKCPSSEQVKEEK